MIHTLRRHLAIAMAAVGLAGALPALAQDKFPDRPIKLIVPYAPGGGTDLVMRAIGPGMADILGQPVIVENKPGGGTINATAIGAKAPADGYTLLAVGAPIYLNAALGVKTPYDVQRDLVPLTLLVKNPGLLVVSNESPARNVKELIALSKRTKGGLSYGSAGNGSIGHLGGEMLKAQLGLDMVHVPYKGSAPVLADLMGNQIPMALEAMIPTGAQVKAGKVRALAIFSKERSPLLPDVPTLAEAGYPADEVAATFGLMLPAGTPPAVVTKLHDAAIRALNAPATRKQLEEMGYQIVGDTPQQFEAFLREQTARWTKIVKDNHIRPDQ